jgi:purine-binding chemotaxis protein CheW
MMLTTKSSQNILAATFTLGQASFGVDTAQIQEVVRLGTLTQVHHAPGYVVGIRNLRGRIVTVIDLCVRLDLGRAAIGPDSRILIVEGQGEPIGLLVDQVADTIDVNPADIHPAPSNVNGVQSRYLRGVSRTGTRLVALLDLNAILQTAADPVPLQIRETTPA